MRGREVIGTSRRTHGAGERDNARKKFVTIWLRSKFSWPVHVLVWYIYLLDEGDKKENRGQNLKKKEGKGGG